MNLIRLSIYFILTYCFCSCGLLDEKIDFNTQVKPIINKNCISCHGGVKKQGGYSLLFKEEAFSKGKSGKIGIVPGDASASEFINRLSLKDPDERMPHEKTPLTDTEIDILTKWVNQGAEWKEHWAYVPVKKINVPSIKHYWIKNDIDKFVLKKAQENSLEPSKEASVDDLTRRSALDIIGYPAPQKIKDIFSKHNKYEVFIDSLLSLPAYGEKWTSMWLDLARYADTKGYERDGKKNVWRYRDWLIKAFNADMPYDQFLTTQLAGDLQDNPDEETYIATAFHRNTMTNDEGGTDNEEFRTAAVIDRVNTTWETLMGTSFSCVQCHSHPYDPFRFEEYYKFMAFFNNTRDEDTYDEYPVIRHYSLVQKNQLNDLGNWLTKKVSEKQKEEIIHFLKTLQPSHNSLRCDNFVNSELSDTKWLAMRNNSSARLSGVNLSDKETLILKFNVFVKGRLELRLGSPKGQLLAYKNFTEVFKDSKWKTIEIPLIKTSGTHDIYFRFFSPHLKDPNSSGIIFDWFYFSKNIPQFQKKQKDIFWTLLNADVEQTPIMLENPEGFIRKTNIFERGSWLSKGKEVLPDTPGSLGKLSKDTPKNRLGLAMWMTSPQNPLVARTIVNRIWEQIFGTGLVETLEDLGSQGSVPTNRDLLDFLSYKFVNDYNWSVKKLIREIMLSATYRQDSKISPEKLKKDPQNKYLMYMPRIRLTAEQIRDQALAVCGVINNQMYGPPVMPFQPEGIWGSPYSDGDEWIMAQNGQQYRRAVYTFWKRTSPYPSMISFDGVGREVCVSRRIRTNTPLQALVTLNDSVYIDLSNQLAVLSLTKSKQNYLLAISIAYKQAIGKDISKNKLSILMDLYYKSLSKYQKEPALAKKLTNQANIKLAALTIVCNSILNLDEVITKS
jgi:hypothetical protein